MEVIVMPTSLRDAAQEVARLQALDPDATIRVGTPADLAANPATYPYALKPGTSETITDVIEGHADLYMTIGATPEGRCSLLRKAPGTGEMTTFALEPYKLQALRITGTWVWPETLLVESMVLLNYSIF